MKRGHPSSVCVCHACKACAALSACCWFTVIAHISSLSLVASVASLSFIIRSRKDSLLVALILLLLLFSLFVSPSLIVRFFFDSLRRYFWDDIFEVFSLLDDLYQRQARQHLIYAH